MGAHKCPPTVSTGWTLDEEPNFQGLQRQVGAQLQDMATLLPGLRHTLLDALQELLKDSQALQELEDTVRGPWARPGVGGWDPGQGGAGQREAGMGCALGLGGAQSWMAPW